MTGTILLLDTDGPGAAESRSGLPVEYYMDERICAHRVDANGVTVAVVDGQEEAAGIAAFLSQLGIEALQAVICQVVAGG